MNVERLKEELDYYVEKYNQPSFIPLDPISIPHQFTDLQNREIMGFWTAMLSWGQRKTIINKANELVNLMDGNPFDFIMNHKDTDLKRLLEFKHRTFNSTDTLYFISFFREYYNKHESLEDGFIDLQNPLDLKAGLREFHHLFFSLEYAPKRTRKHVSTPERKSACKRLNMFLRWMVRKDKKGVDFGVWSKIDMSSLRIPLDVHVFNVATNLGLLDAKKADWNAVEELTNNLKKFDAKDPVKYDYALFSLGVLKE